LVTFVRGAQRAYSYGMTLSSMLVSRDSQEVGVLECILGGLHIGVTVESEFERARTRLAKSKIDALIVDCDMSGTPGFLRGLQCETATTTVPLLIVSGSAGRASLEGTGASFVFEKPISVEQAVHTLSAARNMILDGRLRYHRQKLHVPVTLSCGTGTSLEAELTNLSQGGAGLFSKQSVPVSETVRVSFALPGSKAPFKLIGRVAWTDREGNTGIRFVQVSRKTKRDLQLWLEKEYILGA